MAGRRRGRIHRNISRSAFGHTPRTIARLPDTASDAPYNHERVEHRSSRACALEPSALPTVWQTQRAILFARGRKRARASVRGRPRASDTRACNRHEHAAKSVARAVLPSQRHPPSRLRFARAPRREPEATRRRLHTQGGAAGIISLDMAGEAPSAPTWRANQRENVSVLSLDHSMMRDCTPNVTPVTTAVASPKKCSTRVRGVSLSRRALISAKPRSSASIAGVRSLPSLCASIAGSAAWRSSTRTELIAPLPTARWSAVEP
mmetsp:Transcript_31767/g.83987  ORF Transcript_31767/g.83987 Transcript_31767/m.83987 type:complete len:263 (-) Transcript_31767:130-918(-)